MEAVMLRDDRAEGEGRRDTARNVLGERLEICSIKPMTGFYRDGCCNTGREDAGSHTVCAVLTSDFLEFSKLRGNDLSTPMPEFGFPGLKSGDRWCLCAPRWQEAFEANQAPRVVLRATHEAALAHCSLADFKRFAVDLSSDPAIRLCSTLNVLAIPTGGQHYGLFASRHRLKSRSRLQVHVFAMHHKFTALQTK